MDKYYTIEEIDALADAVRARISIQPQVGMILGSGLGGLADSVENAVVIPYGELPGWPVSTVWGHEGSLVVGQLEGKDVVVMQGRVH